jgi:hypothetical protein
MDFCLFGLNHEYEKFFLRSITTKDESDDKKGRY